MTSEQGVASAEQGRPSVPAEETLRVAVLLSASGGFLDAFTWLAHGGVFANAQTGNVVLLGVGLAAGEWRAALRHVPPIVAFVAGVYVAHRLRVAAERRAEGYAPHRAGGYAARLSLVVELALLCVVAVLPRSVPDLPVVLGIAFTAALQSSSFGRVEGTAYSSVMTTGNLRRAAELVFARAVRPEDEALRRRGRGFVVICGMFALGAASGAFVTVRLGNAGLVAPILLLGAALVICERSQKAVLF